MPDVRFILRRERRRCGGSRRICRRSASPNKRFGRRRLFYVPRCRAAKAIFWTSRARAERRVTGDVSYSSRWQPRKGRKYLRRKVGGCARRNGRSAFMRWNTGAIRDSGAGADARHSSCGGRLGHHADSLRRPLRTQGAYDPLWCRGKALLPSG